jgi:pimeloyl-ACP methyl ester carboxylesterase
MHHEEFRLEDGRRLAYAYYGPKNGYPVLYFHGTPSSRLEPMLLGNYGVDLDALLLAANTRLIAIDRPGMGFSDFNPKGNFLSFAGDVKQLLQHLQINRTQVLCWSGGGPYALALSHQYPDLVNDCHIICGFSRKFDKKVEMLMGMNKWYFRIARRTPWILKSAMNMLKKKRVKRAVPQWITGLPYVDYQLISSPEMLQKLSVLSMKEAAAHGAKGPVYEARGYYREPGYQLNNITIPVHYWWGMLDMSVIRLHAEAVEKKVPKAVMHYREREGHLSLYVNCFKDVLEVISSIRERK